MHPNPATLSRVPHVGRVERKPKPFRCTYEGCNSTFGQKGSLTRHIRSRHENLRPHKCETCKKCFSAQWTLRVHIRNVHDKSKPHQCHLCPKAFGELFNLTKHISIVHEGKKPFACPKCKRPFGYKGDMLKHVAELHQEAGRPYQCKIPSCGVRFARKRYLRRHENIQHGAASVQAVHHLLTDQSSEPTDLTYSHQGYMRMDRPSPFSDAESVDVKNLQKMYNRHGR